MDAKQFAWLYLVENGYANCKHNYYGGWELITSPKEGLRSYCTEEFRAIQKQFRKDILTKGVDWKKTSNVVSDYVSEFADTFSDPRRVEVLSGILVLRDGTRQKWDSEALAVTNVFEMMAEVADAKKRFPKVFGKL